MIVDINDIMGDVKRGLLNQNWSVEKTVDEMQLYSVSTPLTDTSYGIISDELHVRFDGTIGLFVPFTDSEKICWECGGDRMLEVQIDLDCYCVTWFDWCYFPKHERIEK